MLLADPKVPRYFYLTTLIPTQLQSNRMDSLGETSYVPCLYDHIFTVPNFLLLIFFKYFLYLSAGLYYGTTVSSNRYVIPTGHLLSKT